MDKAVTGVRMLLHGGQPFFFGDDVDEQGHFTNNGVRALAALKRHEQIHIRVCLRECEEIIIPYHAVMEYDVMKEVIPVPDVADDFCDTGETAVERTITLPKIAESNQAYQSDVYFILENMLPYMIREGIEVKFMDNVVSSITNGTTTEEQVSWNVEDSNGTHVIAASTTDNLDVFGYPTVDGEEVDALSFTVGTDKRFGITLDNDEYYTEGLYSIGEVITVDRSFVSYKSSYQYDPDAEFQSLPEDKTLPAVEDDFKYELSRE